MKINIENPKAMYDKVESVFNLLQDLYLSFKKEDEKRFGEMCTKAEKISREILIEMEQEGFLDE